MNHIYMIDSLKKRNKLNHKESVAMSKFEDLVVKSSSPEEILKKAKPVREEFEGQPVYLSKLTDDLRVIFSIKEDDVFIITLVWRSALK